MTWELAPLLQKKKRPPARSSRRILPRRVGVTGAQKAPPSLSLHTLAGLE